MRSTCSLPMAPARRTARLVWTMRMMSRMRSSRLNSPSSSLDDSAGAPADALVNEADGYTLFLSNRKNDSGYKGVTKMRNGRYEAYYYDASRKVKVNIGVYDTAVEAAVAYAKHVQSLDGAGASDTPTAEAPAAEPQPPASPSNASAGPSSAAAALEGMEAVRDMLRFCRLEQYAEALDDKVTMIWTFYVVWRGRSSVS